MSHWPSDLLGAALHFSLSAAGVAGKSPGRTPDTCPVHDEKRLCLSVVEGILEGARIQAGSRGRMHGRVPVPNDPSLTVGSRCTLMKGCPAKHFPLLGPERTGHLHRNEPMGGRRDFRPCVSEHALKGIQGQAWLTAGKREAQGS